MTGGRVHRLWKTRGWPVPSTVVGRTQVRSALQDLARNLERLARVVAVLRPGAAWIPRNTTGFDGLTGVLGPIPVRRPFPDVPDHVVQPITVGGKRAHR